MPQFQPQRNRQVSENPVTSPPAASRLALGLLGMILGAVLGGVLFTFAIRSGFYMLALPGACMGLGAGYLSRIRSFLLGAVCGIGALAVGIYLEWSVRPFITDASFDYFVRHLHQLSWVTQAMLVIGVLLAFWFGVGREGATRKMHTTNPTL